MKTENEEKRIYKIAKAGISYVEKHINSEDKEYFYNGLYKIWRYLIGDEDKKIEFLLQEDVQGNIIKLIDSLSEDGKLEFLLREQYNAIKIEKTMERLSEDNRKALEGLSGLEFRKEAIIRIGDEERRLSAIRKDRYLGNADMGNSDKNLCIRNILLSINDESIRIKGLDLIAEEYRDYVINSLSGDDKRMEVMEKMIHSSVNKAGIVRELDKDENKIKFLDNIIEWQKYSIMATLSEENRVKFLDKLTDEVDKYKIVKKLKKEKNKVSALSKMVDEEFKEEIVKSLGEVNQLKSIIYLNEESRRKIVKKLCSGLEWENRVAEAIESLKDKGERKIIIDNLVNCEVSMYDIAKYCSDSLKLELVKEEKENYTKRRIIKLLNDKNKIAELDDKSKIDIIEGMRDTEKEKLIIDLSDETIPKILVALDEESKKEIKEIWKKELENNDSRRIKVLENPEKYEITGMDIIDIYIRIGKEELIQNVIKNNETHYNFKKNDINYYRTKYADEKFILNNLENFLIEEENATEKKQTMLRLYKKNRDILKVENLDILDNRFLDVLGEDKINQISCYPNTTNQIVSLNDNELKILGSCLESYINRTSGDEWTVLADKILSNISQYKELIGTINKSNSINIDEITAIISHSNVFEIKSLKDVDNYKEIKRKKCDKLINSDDNENKKEAVLQKIFGISLKEAKEEVEKFGEDIEKVEDEELKSYIKSLNEIVNLDIGNVLENIFNNVPEVKQVNTILIERMLKNEYGKMYNEGLFTIDNARRVDGYTNVYTAGTDFKMIITSIGAFVENQIDNYYEDWNRKNIATQHMCTCYIRNDMLGCVPIPHLSYGFNQMSKDALIQMGSSDIFSNTSGEFVSQAAFEDYYSPDKLINETTEFNELNFRRIQNGQKKQPDYIVVFNRDGKINNMDEAQKASKEFGGLPIVVIDVQKCLESEKQKVLELKKIYQQEKSSKLAQKLYQKIRNNRVTDPDFCSEIDLERLKDESQSAGNVQNEEMLAEETLIEDLENIYKEIDPMERKKEGRKIKEILSMVKMMTKEGERDGR